MIDMIRGGQAVSGSRPRSMGLEARAHLALLKMKIVIPLVALALLSAALAAIGKSVAPVFERIIALALAGGLASAGAACLNHYLDRDIDVLMERTRQRPIPRGAIGRPITAAALGIGLILAGLAVATRLGWLSLTFVAFGVFFYVVVYTAWLKRRSPLNVVIGGGAGSCAVLAGWTAMDPGLSLTPVMLALLVFSWTPGHFWALAIALKNDYQRAGVPMLPVLIGERAAAWIILAGAVVTVGLSLLPYHLGLFREPYLVAALAGGALTLQANIRLALDPAKRVAWRVYRLSGAELGWLFLAMLMDAFSRSRGVW